MQSLQVLHKGISQKDNKWYEGFYFELNEFHPTIMTYDNEIKAEPIFKNTTCVFTGYLINDQKLFTDDVVVENDSYGKEVKRICIMLNGSYQLKLLSGSPHLPKYINLDDSYKFMKKIQGNIYDNSK